LRWRKSCDILFPTSATSLDIQVGESTPSLNPVPIFRFGEAQITPEIIEAKKFGADDDYCQLHSAEDDKESDSRLD